MRARRYLVGIPVGALLLTAVWAGTGHGARRLDRLELGELPLEPQPGEERSGGDTTVTDTGRNAFGRSPMNMDRARWPDFHHGKRVFDRDWSDADLAPVPVGPLFSAPSCVTCHVKDGRGQPPASPDEVPVSLVFQLSGAEGQRAHPLYGAQLDSRSVDGARAEGWGSVAYDEVRGEFADGEAYSLAKPRYEFKDLSRGPLGGSARFSPRVAPANFGLGLLEAIPEQALLALADPEDANQDGISGRPNYVEDDVDRRPKLGRFGWKANQPTLQQQVAHALFSDMGLTTELLRDGTAEPEVQPKDLEVLMFYTRLLAAPKRRDWDAPQVQRGKAVFRAIGCAGCHVSGPFETGEVPGFPELSRQRIFPYTDLLLHDMGEALADDRPDGLASGREWRTPPLWGIGLVQVVNGHTRYLHDGRARNLEEAVLWHGGEAAPAQERYVRLPREDRAALLAFLKSL
ncbi:c-type cytochrome [Pyxidicoccus fallax]|uniref:C-type cytochrome n=1 Tax=Pyxidicoccus fallax TaxID=394095 RepID=A0A848LEG5_9BACT|nr:di-heme oxidoredictase family protein [Pyxidicoccus fallax]NMO15215.1 c-type cytochrome [Pyxidicoccus fallax]NPC76914.1 c-type cytochrome [Pyxidicoccus fallax]